jgi:hypothetical protein
MFLKVLQNRLGVVSVVNFVVLAVFTHGKEAANVI